MTQRIINTDKALYLMDHRSDGTGRMLFGLTACEDGNPFVYMKVADSPLSSQTMTMTPDVALLAYQWLGRWLQAQGVQLPAQLPARE